MYSALWAIPVQSNFNDESSGFEKNDPEIIPLGSPMENPAPVIPPDTGLRIPIPQPDNNPLEEGSPQSPFFFHNPPGVGTNIEYDPETNTYKFQNTTGSVPYGPGAYMDINEFIDYDLRQEINQYWRDKGASYAGGPNRTGSGLIPQLKIGSDVFESIFGSNTIDIRPSGNAELIFSVTHNNTKNYSLPIRQRRITRFNFDENIQLNLLAKIGDKIEFNLNYNSKSDFEFDNKMKLKYEGKEDDIIQLLEFGDVTLPLNSSLITGSQSLFGLKTQLKFGNLTVTAVASEQNSETKTITVSGGAQTTDFYFRADEYEENKHFFVGQFFRDHYNQYLETLPLVSSPIVITKIEVWRTTVGAATNENRNIVAFTDLGEANPQFRGFQYARGTYPDNTINTLPLEIDTSRVRDINTVSNYLRSKGLTTGLDYEKVENARLLSSNEYTFNSKLGFISLNSALNADQVLAVAFQYQVIGDDNVYQVGEFSNEVAAPNCIRVKLLKSTSLNTKSSLWKLMMKNVYSLSTYQVSSEGFRLNILYTGDEEGIPNGFFNTGSQKGIPLIRLMRLDSLNQQLDPYPDGIFDFIDNAATSGGTINAYNGRIYFPTIEPFGKDLRAVLDPESGDKYAFDSLYTNTKIIAQQYTNKNKFYLEGRYKSSYGSEYHLNAMNIAQGSVKVSAGGIPLTENVDFTVNYGMGTVSIINEGVLNSGTPITISVENRSTFGIVKRRMFGANFDYRFSNDFNIGATILNLSERPLTQKVNFGDEPIKNTIWGMNFAYKTEVPLVTKIVDFLPFHSTTTMSNFQIEGEFAHFIPGHSRQIGKEGTSYIDDFEAAKSTVDLRSPFSHWVMASTPQGQPDMFREALPVTEEDPPRRQLAYGFNRARMAWYIIDNIFYNNSNLLPRNITAEDQSHPYARAVYESELFPFKEQANSSLPSLMSVLNLAYYPSERGPYNFDIGRSEFSYGLTPDGLLERPDTRWSGIMRKMEYTDFESANYEYIEFWMMDPFILEPNHKGGKLYFNLGDISEDILRDGAKFFENGLPIDGTDENVEFTVWGRVPTIQMIVNTFDPNNRQYQDVGYDGLQDSREREHFWDTYLQDLQGHLTPEAYQQIYQDPSADNYHFFRGTDYDNQDVKINDRYKYYNNTEGNSPTDAQSSESYPTAANNIPDSEDVNGNNTLDEEERYYQYVIDLKPEKMVVGENYIVDVYEGVPDPLPDGSRPATKWYQFRIPIRQPDRVIGNISGFNSIRFMRLFLKEFEQPIICRLATFELVRSNWRTYDLNLLEEGDYLPGQGEGETSFNVASISYEENFNRTPIPYVIPPGIERELGYGGTQIYQVNERALTMKVTGLSDGDARAIYKNTNYDLRQFKRLKMFIHAESVDYSDDLKKGDVTVFVRLGSDFTDNYYEYEIPVEMTPWGVSNTDSTRVWPEANRMNIILDSLVQIKQRRNIAIRRGGHESNLVPYVEIMDNGNKVTVVGMPNLGDVTTIMIGIRNPKKKNLNDGDDMLPKSVEVWINELRLTGFNDKTGFAALARARLNLADLGDITLSGSYSTPGFGSLEQSVTERSQETMYSFDLATNIDGGKILFPERWNVKIPIHYDYSVNVNMPEYNPLNPDVKLKDDLDTYETKQERDSIKKMTTAFVQRQNVNLMNVRKERNLDKPLKIRPWDVENLDLSYSYSEIKSRDVDVEFDNTFRHEGQIGYTFNHNPKNYRPLSTVKAFKSNWLQLLRDVNFYLLPKNFTFRTSVIRELNEFKLRPKSVGNIIIDTSYVKNFDWTRNYNLMWDITQALKFDYSAQASARIDEPQGLIDTRAKKDSVWRSFGRGGRTTNFVQRFNASYQIPINKIPVFNWITANVRYSGTYTFIASPLSLAHLGNTIQNSNTMQGSGNINFITLYNNVPYLKKVNQGPNRNQRRPAANQRRAESKPEEEEEDENGKKKKKDENSVNVGKVILDGTVRFLMLVRNASVSYSEGNGTILPGYLHTPKLLGLSKGAPGFLFVFGGQPKDYNEFRINAAQNNWLTEDSLMNSAFQTNKNTSLNLRATLEPFRDFRIDVTAVRNKNTSYTDYFRVVKDENGENTISTFSRKTSGNFSMSFVGLSTFFADGDAIFADFLSYRNQLAHRIAAENPNSQGTHPDDAAFPDGYSGVQQEVLLASFLSAYGGTDPDKVNISSPFPKIPLPNWRVNYNGLTKIPAMKKFFQNFSLLHGYISSYNIGNYTTNIKYAEIDGHSVEKNELGNFIPREEISQVSISEQFSPLIGFDMTLTNSLLIKVEYKKRRDVSLSFTNNQITEVSSDEVVVSAGYRFKDLKIGFVFSGMKRQVVSDLNITAGFGFRDNKTILRKILESQTKDQSQVTAGLKSFTINFAADYQISSMVGLRLFYDQVINRPHVAGANQYDNMNFECGLSVRLMLTQ